MEGNNGRGHPEVVAALAEAGADVNGCVESDGNTLLHVASQRGNVEILSTLIACNASLTVKNKQGQLPFDVAANDEIRQLINDEYTARFDHGLKRDPVLASESAAAAAAAAAAELEQNMQLEGGDVGVYTGSVSANATATSVASADEESEESSEEEDDGF